jgi:pyrimidine-specific ribonucleoside hydrolase
MKKQITLFLILLLANEIYSSPLHLKTRHTVIIDTDCQAGDLRTISLLMSLPGVTTKAIIVSGKSPDQYESQKKIKELLTVFGADSIITCRGTEPVLKVDRYSQGNKDGLDAIKVYSNILNESKEKIKVICLGSLTNLSELLDRDPSLSNKVEEVIWYNDHIPPLPGFNYDYDRHSADNVLSSGLYVDIISNLQYKNASFNSDLLSKVNSYNTKAAQVFTRSLGSSAGETNTETENLRLSEELVAVSLTNHEIFEMSPAGNYPRVRHNKSYSVDAVNEIINDIVTGNYKAGHFVAFNGFPLQRNLYAYDVRLIMDEAIEKFGADEWKACVLTDEFHGHLGVYSIVGAKMGILAKEYFGVPNDMLKVESYAGSMPPFSCMNDGLQVSTGATLGQGTISLVSNTLPKPQAVFRYNNKTITIRLRPDYIKELRDVIDEGVKNYGLEDEEYWTMVRQSAIRFWLEWDRKKIFELTGTDYKQ